MHAVDERGDVDLDDVAVVERAGVRDAVADDLVDAGAQRLREALVAERGRVGAVLDQELVADPVELVGGDAGRDVRADSRARRAAIAAGARIRAIGVGVLDHRVVVVGAARRGRVT